MWIRIINHMQIYCISSFQTVCLQLPSVLITVTCSAKALGEGSIRHCGKVLQTPITCTCTCTQTFMCLVSRGESTLRCAFISSSVEPPYYGHLHWVSVLDRGDCFTEVCKCMELCHLELELGGITREVAALQSDHYKEVPL